MLLILGFVPLDATMDTVQMFAKPTLQVMCVRLQILWLPQYQPAFPVWPMARMRNFAVSLVLTDFALQRFALVRKRAQPILPRHQ